MRSLTTLLAAIAVCAAMLVAAVYHAGGPPPEPHAGLTAADILASDGIEPGDQVRPDTRLDRSALGRLAAEASQADHPVLPEDGHRG